VVLRRDWHGFLIVQGILSIIALEGSNLIHVITFEIVHDFSVITYR